MKYAVGAVVMFLMLPLLLLAPVLGMLVDPWAPFRFSGQVGQVEAAPPVAAVPFDPAVIPVIHGGVTDAFRYQLARAAGWGPAEAITIVAISIAEDGSGDPTALSPKNRDGSFDYGLLQINSSHWNSCGGQQALSDPFNNFACGHGIYLSQGWCAWSTYESSCGAGHTGSYRAYLGRAQAASQVAPLGA